MAKNDPIIPPDYKFTVDCETDWGGRSSKTTGMEKGLPIILETFKKNNVKGLFFFSTELFGCAEKSAAYQMLKTVEREGHAIGSHGHFHERHDTEDRLRADRELSENILLNLRFYTKVCAYRAPRFDKRTHRWAEPYSNPKNHVGLLKMMWFGLKLKPESIFYLHPFDIIGGDNPPNLFCRLWYSRPENACKSFKNLVNSYKVNRYENLLN